MATWGRVGTSAVGARFGSADVRGPDDLAGLFSDVDDPEPDEDADDDEDVAFGPLRALHGWVGRSGPGVALAFDVRTGLDPEIAGIELRLRDDARYVRSALPGLRDRHGDLTLTLDLPPYTEDGRTAYAHLPYAALPRRLGDHTVLEAWLVEDGEPVDELLWQLPFPEPLHRLVENPLAAVALAAISAHAQAARAGGAHAIAEVRGARIEAALVEMFGLDPVGRAITAELVRTLAPAAVGAVAGRLREMVAAEGLPRIFGLLNGLANTLLERQFLDSVAARLGVSASRAGAGPRTKGPRRGGASRGGTSPTTLAHLAVLELQAGATWEEIRTAYRRAASTHHPDRAPPAEQAAAHERMKRINAAYAALRRTVGRGG